MNKAIRYTSSPCDFKPFYPTSGAPALYQIFILLQFEVGENEVLWDYEYSGIAAKARRETEPSDGMA